MVLLLQSIWSATPTGRDSAIGGWNRKRSFSCHEEGSAPALRKRPDETEIAVIVPDCISEALAGAVEAELETLDFSLRTNDCARAFHVAQTDGEWGAGHKKLEGMLVTTNRFPALAQLKETLAQTVKEQLTPSSRDTGPAQKRTRAEEGELRDMEIVVLRRNCYRLPRNGGDFFGRSPSAGRPSGLCEVLCWISCPCPDAATACAASKDSPSKLIPGTLRVFGCRPQELAEPEGGDLAIAQHVVRARVGLAVCLPLSASASTSNQGRALASDCSVVWSLDEVTQDGCDREERDRVYVLARASWYPADAINTTRRMHDSEKPLAGCEGDDSWHQQSWESGKACPHDYATAVAQPAPKQLLPHSAVPVSLNVSQASLNMTQGRCLSASAPPSITERQVSTAYLNEQAVALIRKRFLRVHGHPALYHSQDVCARPCIA